MRVNRNQLTEALLDKAGENGGVIHHAYYKDTGTPLRLEIAAQILSGMYAGRFWERVFYDCCHNRDAGDFALAVVKEWKRRGN